MTDLFKYYTVMIREPSRENGDKERGRGRVNETCVTVQLFTVHFIVFCGLKFDYVLKPWDFLYQMTT